MDSRLYFVLGDLASNLLVGALAGWISALVIGDGWNMWLAMFLAMGLGIHSCVAAGGVRVPIFQRSGAKHHN